mgnify:CR=1 FL=1|tara:strand:+ start:977 stop:1129 length:153 start_codon:yes stop_codon:yes gene_type:complete
MLAHPWMAKDLKNGPKLTNAKSMLSKYVSIRKDKSQKFKVVDGENDDDDV